jgi:hypothetical protein
MVAGSFASTYHGIPRTTQDIDLVIDPTRDTLDALLGRLQPESYYVSREAAAEAWNVRGQFNVIDLASGWKIDLVLRKERPFSREEFARRRPARIMGTTVFVASAEDTIVAKLEWARLSDSERQLRDVVGIIEMSGEQLDLSYVERWVEALGLRDLWARAASAAIPRSQ